MARRKRFSMSFSEAEMRDVRSALGLWLCEYHNSDVAKVQKRIIRQLSRYDALSLHRQQEEAASE